MASSNPAEGLGEEFSPGKFVIDRDGKFVLTKEFLLSRGKCCHSGCRNCPYREKHDE